MRAVFLDFDTLSRNDIDTGPLDRLLPDIEYHGVTPPELLAARLSGRECIILNKVRLDAATLRRHPGIRLIALAATGTDNVDLAAARDADIAVTNIRGYCSASVTQHVFAMLLGLTQQLKGYETLLMAGGWRVSPQFCMLDFPIRELSGKVMGIVGYGELGRRSAAVAQALGMRLLLCQRPGEHDERAGRVPLSELLATADVISLHCPLTPATRNLIGRRELALMKPDAVLINTARGALVDSAALAEALRSGRIGGAGIDVLAQEPPLDGDPLLEPGVPNLILTPHVAWAAREARQRALEQIADCVRDFLAGGQSNRIA